MNNHRAAGVTNYLHSETGWARAELLNGRRFGLLASADHFGVARAGVWTRELTRTGLYEAFMARRVFGTSGLSASIRFTCDGVWMGGETSGKNAGFLLVVEAREPIVRVEIVRDGEDVEQRCVKGNRVELTWKTSLRHVGEFWYCCIVAGERRARLWTSPIWLV